jgi:endoglucanase
MFESINDRSFENVWDATAVSLLEELNTAFVNIVRGSGGQNARRPPVLLPLHTGGLPQANLDSLSNTASKLADPNLIVTVHYYGFWPFGVNIAGSTKFDSTVINDIATVDDGLYNTFG